MFYGSLMEGFRKEGRDEGREQEIFKVALNMIKNKFKINDIMKAIGLSKEEITKLKEKN